MKPPKKRIAPEKSSTIIRNFTLCFNIMIIMLICVLARRVHCAAIKYCEECMAMHTLHHIIPRYSALPKRRQLRLMFRLNHSCSPRLLHTNMISWTVSQLWNAAAQRNLPLLVSRRCSILLKCWQLSLHNMCPREYNQTFKS